VAQEPVVGTYDPARLSTRDRIRALLADTGPAFIIPDVTLDSYILEHTDWRYAAANAADQLASEYAKRVASVSTGGTLSASWIDRSSNLRKLASDLRLQAARDAAAGVAPSFIRSVALTRDEDDLSSEYRDVASERMY
jgi:hypothetical protein